MPLKYWDEAFLTAVYLINRLPSRVIDSQTPVERLFGDKGDYSFLRIFGCACWPNLRPYNSRKLEFRSKQCVFLGYSNLHKGYKCLDIATGRRYISRDIVFDESVFPFSELHSNAGAQLKSEILLLPSSLQPLHMHDYEGNDLHIAADANPPDNPSAESFVQESGENSVPDTFSGNFSGAGTVSGADIPALSSPASTSGSPTESSSRSGIQGTALSPYT
jgi:hypothetical protein